MYVVREVFYTLQGEGVQAGRPAVFCRFVGCNLWSGREEDRATAVCRFCDTEFAGVGPTGGRFSSAAELAGRIAALWPTGGGGRPLAVLTGGEPLLQVDEELIAALHNERLEVAVETNGTRPAPRGVDWLTVSPKAGAPLVLEAGDELKLVHPQPGAEPARFVHLAFTHFVLQPMDGPERERNTRLAVEHCLRDPRWRLGLQAHKLLGLP